MSTYEALLDMHTRFSVELAALGAKADDLARIATAIASLVRDNVATIPTPYLMRVPTLTRKVAVTRKLAEESLRDCDGTLRSVEEMRVRRDVAFDLQNAQLTAHTELQIDKALNAVELELECALTLMEHLRQDLADLAPPQLVAA